MKPTFLTNENLKLILFGGKGGVGKTTSAAATALQTARQGRKTLLISVNPAHSLSDSFDCEIGNKVTKVNDNLYALEVDAEELMKDFRKRHERIQMTIWERGSFLEVEDLKVFFDLSLPGIDEVMAMLKLIEFVREEKYDLFILDMAATGHTITFLKLPDIMSDYNNLLVRMQEKHRYIASRFAGRYRRDEVDEFLENQINDVKSIKSLLSDASRTEFVVVTIPEAMGIEETETFLSFIKSHAINVNNIILNMIEPSTGCDFCAARKNDQEKYIKEISSLLPGYNIIFVPLFPDEIKGIDTLTEFGAALSGKPYQYKPSKPFKPKEISVKGKSRIGELLKKKYQLILFGGKGGLGKTTVAAATAIYMAKKLRDKKILIFSTDPAQALGRSFDYPIGEEIIKINDNLYAVGMNAEKMLDDFKKEYVEEINEMFESFMGGKGGRVQLDLPYDRAIFNALIKLSPPGLDELMALSKIMDLMDRKEYDVYILDTAPSGHLLRLLEMPKIVIDWISAVIRLQIKYREIICLVKTMELLLKWKKRLNELTTLLKDPERTEFVVVTIPEAMGIEETERILTRLSELQIPVHHIVINRIIPSSKCSFCASKRKQQQKHVKEIYEKFTKYAISEMPLFPHEIRGIEALTNFAEAMYEGVSK